MSYKIHFLLLITSLFIFSCGKISHEKFDSNKWKTSNLNLEENLDLRWNMINDLRNNYRLVGESKTQIILLLGKPDTEIKNESNYYSGYSGKGINTGSLTITFDENNKVKKIKVWQG